jgi:ABC-2 type transport system ATP-binding protein
MSDIAAFALEGVTKRYGAVRALEAVSFSAPPGQLFGLIGPDGAGKTTTIRLLCGLLHADGGRVRLLGHDPVHEHGEITRSVGYLSQRFSLYGDLSIDENIAFFAEIHGLRGYQARRDRLLDLTQLRPFRDRLADRLSGGMKQKLALACTLIHEPRVILLDEPTTGVDPVSRREFWKLLAEFLELGITILVSTPYLDEAERCARVALLHEGRLLALDTPDALRAGLPGQIVEMIAADQVRAVSLAQNEPGVEDVQTFGERAHVRFAAHAGAGAEARLAGSLAAAGIAIRSLREVPPSLEDVFIARLQEQGAGTWAGGDAVPRGSHAGTIPPPRRADA